MSFDSRYDSSRESIGAYDEAKIWAYAGSASNYSDMREINPIVILNSPVSDGAVVTVLQGADDDFHGGFSLTYISGPFDSNISHIAVHEMGHAFGKLADEYEYPGYGLIEEEVRNTWEFMSDYGHFKNTDFTGDPSRVKWKHFLEDVRYSNTGLGCYEGAMLFNYGVWRPTENSVMRSQGHYHYNAPSREAIYYRIHKLAYGRDWEYNYDDFVSWDMKNIQHPAQTHAKRAPSLDRVYRKPLFKIEESIKDNGKKSVTVIMN